MNFEENDRRMVEFLSFLAREFNPFLLRHIVEKGIESLAESDPDACDCDLLFEKLDNMQTKWLLQIIDSVESGEVT